MAKFDAGLFDAIPIGSWFDEGEPPVPVPATGPPIDIFGADLKHWWRDGYTPGLFPDIVGGAHFTQATGSSQPAATTVAGHDVPLFDGSNDVLTAGDVTTLDGASGITIFFAVKGPANSDYTGIFGKAHAGQAFWVSVIGGKLVASVSEDLAVADAATDASPFDDEWHRVVYTWSSAAGGTLTLDGVLQSTTEPPGASPLANVAEPLWLGAFVSSALSASEFFEGAIGCAGIATRRATEPEIAQLDAMLASFVGVAVASLNVTLQPATLSATAEAPAKGALSATLAPATLAATAEAPAQASLAATLAPATLSAAAVAPAAGALAVTLAPATLAATASAPAAASLSATLAPATLSATAIAPAAGSLSTTLAPATLSSTAVAPAIASLAATLQPATLSSSATAPAKGELAVTLQAATLESSASAPAHGSLEATLQPATLEASARSLATAELGVTLAPATLDATAIVTDVAPGDGVTWLHLSVAACTSGATVLFPSPSFVGCAEACAGVVARVRSSSGFTVALGVL